MLIGRSWRRREVVAAARPRPTVRPRMIQHLPRLLLVLFALLGPVSGASAWSPDGHRIVGEIAWRGLSPEAKRALRALLDADETLAEASAWADTEARQSRRWRHLEPLHYVNVDPAGTALRVPRSCGCVIGAIEIERDRLADPAKSRAERALALRLVAHFVGDVHQPLHVAHPDGRGGTRVDVRFDGKPTTLHRLWDGGLIARELRERGRKRGPRWRAWAHSLADAVTPAERAQWTASRDPRAWAEESLALGRLHAFAPREGESLGDAYFERSLPVVAERLQQAGVRLAALLETALGR